MPEALPFQQTFPLPADVVRVQAQAWLLKARNGRALFLDPCAPETVETVRNMLDRGEIAAVDGIWITHYHCDHTEAAEFARRVLQCPVITDSRVAQVIAHPQRHFLTCLSPNATPVDRATRHGESWQWENFTLTAYHLPGQTYYHAGLLAERDDGIRYFFVGDSFTPAGIDDYCTWNRNFLKPQTGFARAVELARNINADMMFNPHVDVGFRFSDAAWSHIASTLDARAGLVRNLTPWEAADFATDEAWARTFPYEQQAEPGKIVRVALCVTNHATAERILEARFELPEGWSSRTELRSAHAAPGAECVLDFEFRIPQNTPPGRYVLPVWIRFGDQDLGPFREAIVRIPSRPEPGESPGTAVSRTS